MLGRPISIESEAQRVTAVAVSLFDADFWPIMIRLAATYRGDRKPQRPGYMPTVWSGTRGPCSLRLNGSLAMAHKLYPMMLVVTGGSRGEAFRAMPPPGIN